MYKLESVSNRDRCSGKSDAAGESKVESLSTGSRPTVGSYFTGAWNCKTLTSRVVSEHSCTMEECENEKLLSSFSELFFADEDFINQENNREKWNAYLLLASYKNISLVCKCINEVLRKLRDDILSSNDNNEVLLGLERLIFLINHNFLERNFIEVEKSVLKLYNLLNNREAEVSNKACFVLTLMTESGLIPSSLSFFTLMSEIMMEKSNVNTDFIKMLIAMESAGIFYYFDREETDLLESVTRFLLRVFSEEEDELCDLGLKLILSILLKGYRPSSYQRDEIMINVSRLFNSVDKGIHNNSFSVMYFFIHSGAYSNSNSRVMQHLIGSSLVKMLEDRNKHAWDLVGVIVMKESFITNHKSTNSLAIKICQFLDPKYEDYFRTRAMNVLTFLLNKRCVSSSTHLYIIGQIMKNLSSILSSQDIVLLKLAYWVINAQIEKSNYLPPELIDKVAELLDHTDAEIKKEAHSLFERLGQLSNYSPAFLDNLKRLLDHPSKVVRKAVLRSIVNPINDRLYSEFDLHKVALKAIKALDCNDLWENALNVIYMVFETGISLNNEVIVLMEKIESILSNIFSNNSREGNVSIVAYKAIMLICVLAQNNYFKEVGKSIAHSFALISELIGSDLFNAKQLVLIKKNLFQSSNEAYSCNTSIGFKLREMADSIKRGYY